MILSDQPAYLSDHTRDALYGGRRTIGRHTAVLTTDAGPLALSRDVYEIGEAAGVIAYDPERDLLVLLRQFRMTAHVSGVEADMVEICAGGVDEGETPEHAAHRELKEELGIEALALEPAFQFMPSAGWMAQLAHVFLARVDASLVPDRAGLAEEEEHTLPFTATPDAVLAAIDAGRMRNGFALLALTWFARHRAAIRQRWGFSD
jgi:ADP-ribose pyrophosphatase